MGERNKPSSWATKRGEIGGRRRANRASPSWRGVEISDAITTVYYNRKISSRLGSYDKPKIRYISNRSGKRFRPDVEVHKAEHGRTTAKTSQAPSAGCSEETGQDLG